MCDELTRVQGLRCGGCRGTEFRWLDVENVYDPADPTGPPIEQQVREKCLGCGRTRAYTATVSAAA